MTDITAATLELLKCCSQATIGTQLFLRGFRQQHLVGIRPLAKEVKRFAGEAFTLRFIPSREDKDWDHSHTSRRGEDNMQWEAFEAVGPGQVLMIDSRNDPRAASAGDILITRLMRKGVAAVVTDGAFRDATAIEKMGFPAYCRASSATTRMAYHRAVDMQRPIGCAEVAVYPGDIVVGDADGVTVIPRQLAAEIAKAAHAQEQREEFLLGLIDQGAPLWGTYPPNDETLARYAEWEASRSTRDNDGE